MSSPILDVQQVQYHDDSLLTVVVTDHPPEYNISLNTDSSHSAVYILLW
jgi:hypothetical protein